CLHAGSPFHRLCPLGERSFHVCFLSGGHPEAGVFRLFGDHGFATSSSTHRREVEPVGPTDEWTPSGGHWQWHDTRGEHRLRRQISGRLTHFPGKYRHRSQLVGEEDRGRADPV